MEPGQTVVVVVEDDAVLRLALVEAIRGRTHGVVEFASADEAKAYFGNGGACDGVIVDIHLPGDMDGVGLVEWLRARFPTKPVLVTSGHTLGGELKDIGFFRKPYDTNDVLDRLSALMTAQAK
ncbi:MAG TPA: response regulator [Beijerinckiaceae bacterium]|jgi:CheY-like chemotaxis protein